MRIGELAELAGVTVRTVRYYHQKKVLDEPARRANGYRAYTVDHLVALVRLRQLTQSGLSLAQAGAVVADSAGASTDAALDEIDDSLRRQIAALTDQRRRLAEARSGQHFGLSRLAAALTTTPADIPVTTLYAYLYTDEAQADRFTEALLRPEVQAGLDALQARFEAITESTPADALDQLAAEMRDVLAELGEHVPTVAERQSRLLIELAERRLNDQQRAFLHRLM